MSLSKPERKIEWAGSFVDLQPISGIADLTSPMAWQFIDRDNWVSFLQKEGLLLTSMPCPTCASAMTLVKASNITDGCVFCCKKGATCPFGAHEKRISIRKWSFFEGVHLNPMDVVGYGIGYLLSVPQRSLMAMYGIEAEAAVQWSHYMRDIMCEWFKTERDNLSLGGVNHVVELDESLFGCKMKYHCGALKGQQVWVFGMVDREDGRCVIWPVANRSAAVLLPIVEKFVLPGTVVYSDGWAAYLDLEKLGYSHWVVCHKEHFKVSIECEGVRREVHTNCIEGFWGVCKARFKAIRGTSATHFASYLVKQMYCSYRSQEPREFVQNFFEDLKRVYPCTGPASISDCRLFDLDLESLQLE